MKKKVLVTAALALALTAGSAYAATPQYVTVNGQNVAFNYQPFVQNSVTMVQFKPIFQSLGVSIQWDQKTKTITGTKDDKVIKLTVASKTAYINGKKIALQTAPVSLNGNIFVPLRFISEATGASLNVNGNTIEVTSLTASSNSGPNASVTPAPSAQDSKPSANSSLSSINSYLNKSYSNVNVNGVTYHLEYELSWVKDRHVLDVYLNDSDEITRFLKEAGDDVTVPYKMLKDLQADLNNNFGLSKVYTYYQWQIKDVPVIPKNLEHGEMVSQNSKGTYNITQIIIGSAWDYVEGAAVFMLRSSKTGEYMDFYETLL
ncbi:copper amine oxidase N-terminal domain-containing protein [Paenibacillus barcinonensis]|uniref:copper amine oxidase N-terminal domain-containing protein n=1 Tax=Paenibacillus barcinonensis TaxID=198119 RepID=UPI001C113123|nr:copper amine oxidase N-terminal domain-containing protein [Paenibacillus barcinonensis]MBU5354529.1 copper amine oxidase N-terminal domain-containing protein [Paenibacillus barcinonensis]